MLLCFGQSSLRGGKGQDSCFHVYVYFDNFSFLPYNVLSNWMGDVLRGEHQPSRKGNCPVLLPVKSSPRPSLLLITHSYPNQREGILKLPTSKGTRAWSLKDTYLPLSWVPLSPSIPQHPPSPQRRIPPTHNPQPGSRQRPIYAPHPLSLPPTGLQPASSPLIVSPPPPNSTHPQATVTAKKKPFVHESSTCITQTHNTTIIHPAPRKTRTPNPQRT